MPKYSTLLGGSLGGFGGFEGKRERRDWPVPGVCLYCACTVPVLCLYCACTVCLVPLRVPHSHRGRQPWCPCACLCPVPVLCLYCIYCACTVPVLCLYCACTVPVLCLLQTKGKHDVFERRRSTNLTLAQSEELNTLPSLESRLIHPGS